MKHWLLKSEPDAYCIDDLARDKKTLWENVRNYQARNLMMNEMKVGDLGLFYHSNANPAAVVGVVEISGESVPDPTQFDKKSEYYDEKASLAQPRWFCVEVKFKEKLKREVSLEEIKATKSLSKMVLLNNSRLSVQPVSEKEFKTILEMASKEKQKEKAK